MSQDSGEQSRALGPSCSIDWSDTNLGFVQRARIKLFLSVAMLQGAQWLSGRVLDSRPRGHRLEPHRHHCIVILSKNIYPSLVLVQPRKTRPFITE